MTRVNKAKLAVYMWFVALLFVIDIIHGTTFIGVFAGFFLVVAPLLPPPEGIVRKWLTS